MLVSITASEDIQLDEITAASNMIYEEAHPDANIIWGATFDPSLQDEMRITIIATGFVAESDGGAKRESRAAMAAKAASEPASETPVAPAVEPEYVPSNGTYTAPAAPVHAAPAYQAPQPSTPVAPTAPTAPVTPAAPTVRTTVTAESKNVNSAADAKEAYSQIYHFVKKSRKS